MTKSLSPIYRGIFHGAPWSLFLRSGQGADVQFVIQNPPQEMAVRLGIEQPWHAVVKSLVHELLEVALYINGFAFNPAEFLTRNEAGRYWYHFSHDGLDKVATEVGEQLTYVMPVVSGHYRKLVDGKTCELKRKVRKC